MPPNEPSQTQKMGSEREVSAVPFSIFLSFSLQTRLPSLPPFSPPWWVIVWYIFGKEEEEEEGWKGLFCCPPLFRSNPWWLVAWESRHPLSSSSSSSSSSPVTTFYGPFVRERRVSDIFLPLIPGEKRGKGCCCSFSRRIIKKEAKKPTL